MVGFIFRFIGHTLPVCWQLSIFPIQSCTICFITEFSATKYCRILIFCLKFYNMCILYRGIYFQIHRTYTFCLQTSENFHRQYLCAQFFVTLFSATDWYKSGGITLWPIRPQCSLVPWESIIK